MRGRTPVQMNKIMLERWVPFRNEGDSVRFRVFCVPHAGGHAAFYLPLRNVMPPEIDFCPLELPGRMARLAEVPINSMSALVDRLGYVLQPLLTLPFGFFGHSVGAHVAYESARGIRSGDGRPAVHLFVSGRGSPRIASIDRSRARHPRSDSELVAVLARFGGTPAAIMRHPELLAALLPALRADLALAEDYAIDGTETINCPITAFGGSDDVCMADLQSWRERTSDGFRAFILPGGHFYFSSRAKALATEIARDLRASVNSKATNERPQT